MEKIERIKQWLGTGSVNIFGIQFSGKDTVGGQLATLLNAEFISSGDVMRATFLEPETAVNEKVWEAAKVGSLSGFLMPTDEFQHMMAERFAKPDLTGKPLVLSTIGRWKGEERPIMASLEASGHPTKAVLFLQISEREAWQRWHAVHDTRNGGRHDDIDENKVARRMSEFKDKTLPVIDIYRGMGILREINGEQPREKVFADVIDALYEFSRASTSP